MTNQSVNIKFGKKDSTNVTQENIDAQMMGDEEFDNSEGQ